jgi:hypothetical protein
MIRDFFDFDDVLDDTECPAGCGCIGMEPDGSFDFRCPNCGAEGEVHGPLRPCRSPEALGNRHVFFNMKGKKRNGQFVKFSKN